VKRLDHLSTHGCSLAREGGRPVGFCGIYAAPARRSGGRGLAERGLKATGDNSYPDAAGKPNGPEPTEAFNRYLEAIKKLTGGKTFQ